MVANGLCAKQKIAGYKQLRGMTCEIACEIFQVAQLSDIISALSVLTGGSGSSKGMSGYWGIDLGTPS